MATVKYLKPPETLEECVDLLERYGDLINERSQRGEVLRECESRLQEVVQGKVDKAKEENPLAFFKPSYEQAIKLNAWVWGVNFICDFDANRIGKTAGGVVGAQLWIVPMEPTWRMMQSYTDEFGREVDAVLQRPSIHNFRLLQEFLDQNPEWKGDPLKPLSDPENKRKFAKLQNAVPQCFKPAFPNPSFCEKINAIWLGAPDVDYHKDIIMPEWRKWLPKKYIVRDSEHDKSFTLKIEFRTEHGTKRTCNWEITCKSYESKDTKWSGSAVRGIVLTEGLTLKILSEIKQRFQNEAFASWDYTPYEARNTGQKSSLAHRVFKGEEKLPLRHFVYSGFGIEYSPDYIIGKDKKADMIRNWQGKAEGQARIYGKFFTDVPQVLSNLDRTFHTLTWSKEFLFQRFPTGVLCRAMDPGYDHPTSCVWGLLSPNNEWYIYRGMHQAGLSIGERCQKIISLSGNSRYQVKHGENPDDFYWTEYHPDAKAEPIIFTVTDYHMFKTDENTKQPYSRNYIKEGLIVRPSITMRPKDRGNELDRLLEKSPFRVHPETRKTPGARVYFLINEPGVAEMFDRLENVFWARYLTGEHAGIPKDEIQSHGDDDFDTLAYLTLQPLRWSSELKVHRKQKPENYDPNYFLKQFRHTN